MRFYEWNDFASLIDDPSDDPIEAFDHHVATQATVFLVGPYEELLFVEGTA